VVVVDVVIAEDQADGERVGERQAPELE